MTAQENEALVREQLDLYNDHDLDPDWIERKFATLAEDCEITDMASGTVHYGVDGFKQVSRFYTDGFPDHQIEITNVVATEEQVVVEFVGRGTHTGPLHLDTGDLPPGGQSGELRCCNVYRISQGKIISIHSYYDVRSLQRQLGLSTL